MSSIIQSEVVSPIRNVWESMVKGAHINGIMRHPITQQELEYATLQHGGQGGQFGTMCQKWTPESGLEKLYEPEPPVVVVVETPEQPEPPGFGDVSGVEKYSSEPIHEESVSAM